MKTKAAKPKPKTTLKPKAKTKSPVKSAKAKVAAPPVKTGFMWKLLERKEADLKRRQLEKDPQESAYARFNGPRRRSA